MFLMRLFLFIGDVDVLPNMSALPVLNAWFPKLQVGTGWEFHRDEISAIKQPCGL